MNRRCCLTLLVVLAASSARAQTVQLPSFGFSTVNTTVSVPDGGTALLGGVDRISEGRTSRGVPMLNKIPGVNRLFRNDAIGRNVGVSTMSVTPRIIILEEEEERQVGRPSNRVGRSDRMNPMDEMLAKKADFLSRNIARRDDAPVLDQRRKPTLEDTRKPAASPEDRKQTEALAYFEKGQQAETAGKIGAAKIYYNMAATRSSGTIKELALARLVAIVSAETPAKLAVSDR